MAIDEVEAERRFGEKDADGKKPIMATMKARAERERAMTKFACPICGDPNAYPIWIDPEPPQGCPDDEAWQTEGGVPAIRNVTECVQQMKRARDEAERRIAAPDCFDENGKIIPEKTAEVFHRWIAWQNMQATMRGERR